VWTVRTVAAILANPRYTGRQVWNRQRTDHHETVPGNSRTSTGKTRAWNPRSEWVISQRPAHPALVSEVDFRTAQTVTATATPHDDQPRSYALTGLLICQPCGRRLHPHWVHRHPGYRCRHGHTSAHQPDAHPRWIYWPEHRLRTEILAQLADTGRMPADAGIHKLVAYLRDRDAVIVCSAATITVDDPTDAEPASPTGPGPTPLPTPLPSSTTVTPVVPQPRPRAAKPASGHKQPRRLRPGRPARFVNGVTARLTQRTPPPPPRNRE
jgi:hypothetical protein